MKRRHLTITIAFFVALAGLGSLILVVRDDPSSTEITDDEPWRRVLTIDVTNTSRARKADLGNNTILIATHHPPVGWDLAVYAYPLNDDSENLLYDGVPSHGPQPWQSFAWSKKKQLFPDTRVIRYGQPEQKLKIVLKDCYTDKTDTGVVFTNGTIEVYHNP